jgi:hypothetical protein
MTQRPTPPRRPDPAATVLAAACAPAASRAAIRCTCDDLRAVSRQTAQALAFLESALLRASDEDLVALEVLEDLVRWALVAEHDLGRRLHALMQLHPALLVVAAEVRGAPGALADVSTSRGGSR